MNQNELAQGLGISAAMVSKLKKRGMPVSSIEAAEKWRRRHLEPGRAKGMKAGTVHLAGPFGDVSAGPVDAALQRACELGLLALDALDRGSFGAIAPTLQRAMHQVPIGARRYLQLPERVWDALTSAIPLALPIDASAIHETDLGDDFMGTFWYQLALGELSDQVLR